MSRINLKVSEAEKKANDNLWYKDYLKSVLPTDWSTLENYNEMKRLYEIINNDLSGWKRHIDEFCNPLGENIGQIEEELLPYPLLHNNLNVLKGESLKRSGEFKVLLLSAKAIKNKNKQLLEAIQRSVDEKVNLEIEKIKKQLEGMPEEEAQAYIEQMKTQEQPEDINIKNFQSEWEIFYNHVAKYCYFTEDIRTKRMDTTEDVFIADRMFLYSGWKNGKPYIEVRNPLYVGFKKDANELYVQKGDYVFYKKPITISDAIQKYSDELSEADIQSLGTANNSAGANPMFNVGKGAEPVHDTFNSDIYKDLNYSMVNSKLIGLHQGQGAVRKYMDNQFVWETHFEFKAFRKIIFLTYTDEYGEKIITKLDDTFKIPKEAVKTKFRNKFGDQSEKFVWVDEMTGVEYTAEPMWIPRKYEVIRLGSDIFPICREVPFQVTSYENPYTNFELSTKGAIFTSRNAKSVSLVERAVPSYLQALYIKHIQNRELAKYQGAIQSIDVDQIPDDLGKDIYGEDIRDKVATYLFYLKKTNKDFYSGSQNSNGGLPPSTRSPGSSGYMLGTAVELMNLQNLLDLLEREVGLAMGIPPQRKAEYANYTTNADNNQALQQSAIITEPYFYLHNEIWKYAIQDYLYNFRTYCEILMEDDPSDAMFYYMLPDGTQELLKVTPNHLDLITIGLYVTSSDYDRQYNQMMLQMVHAFSQNQGQGVEIVSELVKNILSGTSPEETHKKIQILSEKQVKQAQQSQEAQLKSQEKIVEMQNANREDLQAHEMAKLERQGEIDKELKILDVYKFQSTLDANKDGKLDPLAALAQMEELNLKQRKVMNDERSQSFEEIKHKDAMEIKKEELKIKKEKPSSK
jgi:hypothetical protein